MSMQDGRDAGQTVPHGRVMMVMMMMMMMMTRRMMMMMMVVMVMVGLTVVCRIWPAVHVHLLPRRAGDFAKNDQVGSRSIMMMVVVMMTLVRRRGGRR
jgi:hypothetical protein